MPSSHPLRRIRAVVDEALDVLSPDFDGMYAQAGRPLIAPEKLLRALLLQAFYSVRSERQLMEQLVPQLAVEALDIAVLPWTARLDVGRLGANARDPALHARATNSGHELRPRTPARYPNG